MTYAVSAALQSALYARLATDADVEAAVGAAIYDAVPAGDLPGTYVSLGPEDVRDASDATGRGAEHRLTVSIVSDAAGFQTAKQAAAAVSDCLLRSDLTLARGHLVSLAFLRGRARRTGRGGTRRIDLVFRARVEDDPKPQTE